jgi:ribonuclease P/MRP protein subunit POP5
MGHQQSPRKLKPILPSLRQKKRYIAFEVISDAKIPDARAVHEEIARAQVSLLGSLGVSYAGPMAIEDAYNQIKQRGIIKVSNAYVGHAKAALALVRQVGGHPVAIRSVASSGMLTKSKKFTAG